MSGKSRRAHQKLSKREKEKRRLASLAKVIPQPVTAQVYEPTAPVKAAIPPISKPASVPTPVAVKYPYITREVRNIAILAGAVLVVLIILSLVLP